MSLESRMVLAKFINEPRAGEREDRAWSVGVHVVLRTIITVSSVMTIMVTFVVLQEHGYYYH